MKNKRKMLTIILITYIIFLLILVAMILPAVIDVFSYELIRNISIEVLVATLLILITFISILIFMLISVNNIDKKNAEKISNKSIHLDDERSYLERQINEINKKLVSTDKRWQEAYHLIMSSQIKQHNISGKISTENFLNSFGINMSDVKIEEDLVFVLTPFHNDFEHTYQLINNVCNKIKLKAVRGDETFIKNDILKHIIKHIVKSRIIIANLDGRNPNVFYELGIAHALNKPTILLAHVETKIPVDINNQYLILYENENQLREKLLDTLLKVLTTDI